MLARFRKILDQAHLDMIASWACDHTPETLMLLVDEIRCVVVGILLLSMLQ